MKKHLVWVVVLSVLMTVIISGCLGDQPSGIIEEASQEVEVPFIGLDDLEGSNLTLLDYDTDTDIALVQLDDTKYQVRVDRVILTEPDRDDRDLLDFYIHDYYGETTHSGVVATHIGPNNEVSWVRDDTEWMNLSISYTLSISDTLVNDAWQQFMTSVVDSNQPVYYKEVSDTSPSKRCVQMARSKQLGWPWIVVPKLCTGDRYWPKILYDMFVIDFRVPIDSSLTCGYFNVQYDVVSIQSTEQEDDKNLRFKDPMQLVLYDRKTGDHLTYTLPGSTPLGLIPEKYRGWADPPAIYFMLMDECVVESQNPIKSYKPEEETQYVEVRVANPEYNSIKCIAYRVLGGAGTPSNPHWDPQCEYPYHIERVPFP